MEINSTTINKDMIDAWVEKVVSSCAHHDSDQAYSVWRRWDEMTPLLSPEQKSEMMNLQEELTYTAFPSFPQDVATSLVEKHFVSFLRSPVDIDEMIQNRYLYLGYGFEEDDRQALREAALKNQEQVGGKSVAEWISALDAALTAAEDKGAVVTQFFTRDPSVISMSKLDQAILRRLFQVYFDFLAFPVVTIYGLAETARKLAELEKSGVKEINVREFFAPDRTAPQDFTSDVPQASPSSRQAAAVTTERIELPLLKALGKFEKLGGQQVTNSKIVIKGQNDPVRPTIFNWLRAYRDDLGVGSHDSVVRGQFLFQSINGKGLSADEREQVGMLLRSLDDNTPLTIDAGRQEVVFMRQSTVNRQQGIDNRQQITNNREQIQKIRYQISETERPIPIQTAVAPLKSGTTAPRDGNISRAVFEIPVMNHGMGNNPNSGRTAPEAERPLPMQNNGTTAPANRSSAFEQAKAIQQANRESRLSISNIASETVELGRMTAPREEIRPVAPPRPPIAPAIQGVAPAPRAISFEPAKIDTFSFGAGDQKTFSNSGRTPQTGERPLPTRTEDFRPNFAPRDDMNVSALSFSTNHVMPAEKESINRQQLTDNREQSMERDSNSGLRQPSESAVREENAKPLPALPLERGEGVNGGATALPVSMPVQKTATPANRYRITPTGHRDTVASDDTPSPHVVDLRS